MYADGDKINARERNFQFIKTFESSNRCKNSEKNINKHFDRDCEFETILYRRRLKVNRVSLLLRDARGEKSRLVGTHRREYSHKLAEPGRIEPPENIPAGWTQRGINDRK